MATHSSILSWRIPGTEEPVGLPSMGSHRVGHDWRDLAAAVQFSSVARSCPTLCSPMNYSMPGFPVHPNSRSLLRLMSIELVMPTNHLILYHPLLLHLQSFPASGSFPRSRFFTSDSQSIGSSASVLPMNIQHWFPLGWTGWISLQSEFSRVFSNTTVQKHQFFGAQLSLWSNSYMTTRKTIALSR